MAGRKWPEISANVIWVVHFLLVSCFGFALNVHAQNCSQPVPGPNMQVKGKDILLEMFPDRAKVYFACDTGYQPAGGSSSIICKAGRWTSVRLICEKKNCGSAGELHNGNIEYHNSTEFGDTAIFTCDLGYVLVGRDRMICENQGWSGRLPVCEEVTCDPPPQILNGNFSPDKEWYSYRDVVQYTCKKDTLIGSKSRTCSADGTFTPDAPRCAIIECEEPAVNNADWIRRPPYRFRSILTFQCRPGYNVKGEQTQTCDINSQWSPGLPICEPKGCSPPVPGSNMTLKGNNTQTFLHGTTVSFTCNVGYTGGSGDITCSFGSWSRMMLKCQRKDCGPLKGELMNGKVAYPEGTEYGDKAVITCDTGYKLVGQGEIICGDQGWNGSLPVCQEVTCAPPPEIINGTFSPHKEVYSYKHFVLYSCNNDSKLNGSESSTCSEDGTFKPNAPTCALIECALAVDNAEWERKPIYRPGATVRFQRRMGYNGHHTQTHTCGKDGRWSPGLPTCQLIQCAQPSVTNADIILGSQGSYGLFSNITFRCKPGYYMQGVDTQTCNEDDNGPNHKFVRGLVVGGVGGGGAVVVVGGVILKLLVKKHKRGQENEQNTEKETPSNSLPLVGKGNGETHSLL